MLTPKEETGGIDFLKILDDFDPAKLTKYQLEQFTPRNPYVTGYPREESYYYFEGEQYPAAVSD